MRILAAATLAGALHTLFAGCGGAKSPPKSPDDLASINPDGGAADAAAEPGKKSVCAGADLDLLNVLVQSACEVPNAAPDAKARDMTGLLEVKVDLSSAQVAPGARTDVTVTFTNKSPNPLPLDFLLDPTPRFSVEAYTAANKRGDLPRTKPPAIKGGASPDPSAPGTAEVTLSPGGKASAKLDWSAVKLKWAPELVKGTPPEQGYPTAPNGPLPKGKYILRVVTPLIGVFEGVDHEVSTSKAPVTVQ